MQLEQRLVGDVAVVTVIGDITLKQGGDVLPCSSRPPSSARFA